MNQEKTKTPLAMQIEERDAKSKYNKDLAASKKKKSEFDNELRAEDDPDKQ